jgi:hypothetical protein
VPLKKLFAISFLLIYLFSTTELFQLLKAPLLVQHFIEHREENRNITLWQFLCIHYAMGDVKDSDYDKDMKLPFKSHENCLSSISNICISLPETFLIPQPKQIVEEKTFATEDDFLHTSFLSSIWQPPRVC